MLSSKRTHIEASNKARKELDHIHHHLKVNNYRYYSLFWMRVMHNFDNQTKIQQLLWNPSLVFWTKDVQKMKINFGQNNKIMHHSHLKYPVPKQKLLLDFFNHNLAIKELEFPNGILDLGSLCFITSHDRSFARAQTH